MAKRTLAEMNMVTAAVAARGIQEMLNVGNYDFALRLVSVALEVIRRMDREHFDEYVQQPDPIDDVRWNALLLTAIRWQLGECGYPVPDWTLCSRLEEPLFLYDEATLTPAWRERQIQRTPPLFSELNIWCDAARDFSTA